MSTPDTQIDRPLLRRRLLAASVPAALAATGLFATPAHAEPSTEDSSVSSGGRPIRSYTIADLRAMRTRPTDQVILVTDPGRDGLFRYDPTDRSSQDNGGTKIVSKVGGFRFHRQFTGAINPRWFGAIANGEADDTQAIQAAVTEAQARSMAVQFPAGAYRLSAPILIDSSRSGLAIRGDGRIATIIGVHSSVTEPLPAMFRFSDSTRANYFEFTDLLITGQGKAQYGIHAAQITHASLRRVSVGYTTVAGVGLGYGWNNVIDNCVFWNNQGDGFRTVGEQNNHLNIVNTLFVSNAGVGLRLGHSALKVRITGCDFEQSRLCSIYVHGDVQALEVSNCYFESNGKSGFELGNPTRLIRAEIVVNGVKAASTDIGSDWPSGPVVVDNNYCNISGGVTHLVAAYSSFGGLQITNNAFLGNSAKGLKATLLRTGTSQTGRGASVENIRMHGNGVFNHPSYTFDLGTIDVDDLGGATTGLHNTTCEGVVRANYAPTLGNFKSFTAGTRWTPRPTRYRTFETHELSRAGTVGFEIDVAEYLELADRHVYFACSVKATTPDSGAVVASSQLGAAPEVRDTSWRVMSIVDKMPATGTVRFTIAHSGPGGAILVAHPVLSEIGVRYDDHL